MLIPNPNHMSFEAWAPRFVQAFPDEFIPRPPTDESKWSTWVQAVLLIPEFQDLPRPSPEMASWKQWARRVIQQLA